MRKSLDFFADLPAAPKLRVIHGIGSAEGLARELSQSRKLLIAFDELRSFVDKCQIQNSTLLPMTTSLFENRNWDNPTKDLMQSISIRDARLSIIGCCTIQTYGSMWTKDAISIGFPNR